MRVDVPTLACDRCHWQTQDLMEMSQFTTLRRSTIGGEQQWDLCPACYALFQDFMEDS